MDLAVVKEDAVSLQLNKMGVVNMISAIKTPLLQMVAAIVIIHTISYIFPIPHQEAESRALSPDEETYRG